MTTICAFCLSKYRNLTLIDEKYWKIVDFCVASEDDKLEYLQGLQRKQALQICWECSTKLKNFHQFISTSQQCLRVLNTYLEAPTQALPVSTSKLYRTHIEIVEIGPQYEATEIEDVTDTINIIPKYEVTEIDNVADTMVTGLIYKETKTEDVIDTCPKYENTGSQDVTYTETDHDMAYTIDTRPIYEETETEELTETLDVKVENHQIEVLGDIQTPNDAAKENFYQLETSSPADDDYNSINFMEPAGDDNDDNKDVFNDIDIDDNDIEEYLTKKQLPPEIETSKVTQENITSKPKDNEKLPPEPKFTAQWVSKEQAQAWYTSEREQERLASPTHTHLCDKCQRGLAGEQELQAHVELRHSETAGIYICHMCQYRFPRERLYRSHIESHFLLHKCKKCSYETRTSREMHAHCKTEHVYEEAERRKQEKKSKEDQKARTCTRCKNEFQSSSELRAHLSGCALYKCSECNESYGDFSSYYGHLKTHPETNSEEAEMYCETCDIQFKTTQVFRKHMNYSLRHVSRDEYRYQCEYCNTKYPDSSNLRKHVAVVHLKKGKYQCEVCPKSYNERILYQRHLANQHNIGKDEQRNKTCDMCGKTFSSMRVLKDHIRTHTGEKPFKCEFCTSAFATASTLYTHCKLIHKKKIYTSKTKVSKGAAFEDIETKKHVCEECGKTYRHALSLRDHIDYVHRGRTEYVCKYCDKMFSARMGLTNHNRHEHGIKYRRNTEKNATTTEEDTDRVKCRDCDATFRHKSALYRHYKTKHLNLKRDDRVRIRNLHRLDKELIVDLDPASDEVKSQDGALSTSK